MAPHLHTSLSHPLPLQRPFASLSSVRSLVLRCPPYLSPASLCPSGSAHRLILVAVGPALCPAAPCWAWEQTSSLRTSRWAPGHCSDWAVSRVLPGKPAGTRPCRGETGTRAASEPESTCFSGEKGRARTSQTGSYFSRKEKFGSEYFYSFFSVGGVHKVSFHSESSRPVPAPGKVSSQLRGAMRGSKRSGRGWCTLRAGGAGLISWGLLLSLLTSQAPASPFENGVRRDSCLTGLLWVLDEAGPTQSAMW